MSDSKALAIVPKSLTEVSSLADTLAKSTLLPEALRGKQADIVVSILAGQELGLAPMAAIRGVHVVQGKPLLSADTMVGLVLASGLCEYFICVEETDASVTYETKRKGAPKPQRCTWTVEDTKRAGLQTKDNWRTHTRQMMKARCKSILARDAYPDVLAGVYDPNAEPEVFDRQPSRPRNTDAVDAEIVSESSGPVAVPDPPELVAVDNAASVEELTKLVPSLSAFTGALKKEAKRRYGARLTQLEQQALAADAARAAESVENGVSA